MSYKDAFSANNTDLQAVLDKINALPDAVDISAVTAGTATASDIAKDATAYVNGEKVTGIVPVYESGYGTVLEGEWDATYKRAVGSFSTDTLMRSGSSVIINCPDAVTGDELIVANDSNATMTITSVSNYYRISIFLPNVTDASKLVAFVFGNFAANNGTSVLTVACAVENEFCVTYGAGSIARTTGFDISADSTGCTIVTNQYNSLLTLALGTTSMSTYSGFYIYKK